MHVQCYFEALLLNFWAQEVNFDVKVFHGLKLRSKLKRSTNYH